MTFRLPNDGQRVFVCGQTGSGKTRAGVWQLSLRSYDRMPWVIIDFKGDELVNAIPHTDTLRLEQTPKRPGLYVVHPRPDQHELLQRFLWRIWERGHTGLYIDEGYMVGGQGRKSEAFDAILTQGRSKRIPCITLTQRPVWLPRFVVSEADFYQVFHLNGKTDRDKVREFVPLNLDMELPRFWSHWYDVANREHIVLRPVPDDNGILETFYDRLKPKRRAV